MKPGSAIRAPGLRKRTALTTLAFAALAAVAALAAGLAACPEAAAASSATQRYDVPLAAAGTLPSTLAVDAAGVRLVPRVLWRLDASSALYRGLGRTIADPRSIEVASDAGGRYLVIADRGTADGSQPPFVALLPWPLGQPEPSTSPAWTYTRDDDPDLSQPFSAQLLSDGNVLIADRGAYRVFEVDRTTKKPVWQYGQTNTPGLDTGLLEDPFAATRLPNGDTLICDNNGGNRVLEVDSTGAVVWRYGVDGRPGSGPGHLTMCHSAQRLSNGDTLIADSADDRIIEVDKSGDTVWTYGRVGHADALPGDVSGANFAVRLEGGNENGDTLIADTDNGRVIEVDQSGSVLDDYDLAAIDPHPGLSSEPRSLVRLDDGSTLVADSKFGDVTRIGYSKTATFVTAALDSGRAYKKVFGAVGYGASRPTGTDVRVAYRIDGHGVWRTVPAGGGTIAYSAAAFGAAIQFRVTISTDDRSATPTLSGITVRYRRWISGDTRKAARSAHAAQEAASRSAQATGSTTDTSSGSGGGTGGGNGSGTGSGSAVGSGSAAGSGSGAGASSAATGSATAGSAAAAGAAAGGTTALPLATAPPQSTASAASTITGELVGMLPAAGSASSVSSAAGSQGGAAAGGAAGDGSRGHGAWLLAAVLLCATLLVAPGAAARRRLRALQRHDHPEPDAVGWVVGKQPR